METTNIATVGTDSSATAAAKPAAATRTKIYYARSMTLRGKNIERRDIRLLESLGFEVVNAERPESEEDDYSKNCQYLNQHFGRQFGTVDEGKLAVAVAYRPYPNGSIPMGMSRLLSAARGWNLPIIELPIDHDVCRRSMDGGETEAFLAGMGWD